MTVEQIKEKSGLTVDVAESLYWKSIWLRDAEQSENVDWSKMLRDIKYRCMKKDFSNKH